MRIGGLAGAVVVFSLLLATPAGATTLSSVPGLTPTIESDKADYAPGSTVTLTGSGWSSGEAVHITVNDNVGSTWSYSTDVTTNSLGGLTTQFKLPSYLVASYLVTATGPSGTATTTFTDSNPYNLDQCTNGGVGETPEPCRGSKIQPNGAVEGFKNWENGDANGQKAHWKEGDFVPYRARISGIGAGTHTLTLEYDVVASSKHALDYLGSYDATETTESTATPPHANKNNPCLDLVQAGQMASGDCNPTSVRAGNKSEIPIPTLTDCGESKGTGPNLKSSPGNVVIFGPSGTSLGTVTYKEQNVPPSGTGKCSTLVNITFTSPAVDAKHTIVIAWGGHIASEADWGAGNSASSISGSPYHMAVDSLDGVGGSEDHQLATSSIVFTPSIATVIINNATNKSVTGGTVTLGATVHDTATMEGQSSNAAGTVKYERFTTINCTGTSVNQDVTVSEGKVPNSANFTPTVAGSYSYKAIYEGTNGPPQNLPAESPCEPLTVNLVTPAIKTKATTPVTIGNPIKDTATLSGLVDPTGTGKVTFKLYETNNAGKCENEVPGSSSTKSFDSNGSVDSSSVTPTKAGTYYWIATYSGDGNNEEVATSCGDSEESSVVNKATPTIETKVLDSKGDVIDNEHPAAATTEVHDQATLGGEVSGLSLDEGATVTYHFYSDNECKSEVASKLQTVEVNSDGTVPPSTSQKLQPGSYSYKAVYNGNSNYSKAEGECEKFRVVQKSLITNTVLCTFDENTSVPGSTFRLIFTPYSPGSKLSASNPGQFYYNVFDNEPTGKITFTLPYPFVTQGAVPIHVYSSVATTTVSGQTCLIPGTEIAHSSEQITLESYKGGTFGSTTTATVAFTSKTGFAYANIHVQYGLKGTSGWSKGGVSGKDAVNSLGFPTIVNDQTYLFEETDGSPDKQTASSENVFKKDPGIAGLVEKASGDPVANVPVYIYDSSNHLVFKGLTDQDGWYQWEYKYTGKAATFTVKLGSPYTGHQETATIKSNGFALVNFLGL
jgi:hypothetical protein